MKLLSYTFTVTRHFSSRAIALDQKKWGKSKSYLFGGKEKYARGGFETLKVPKIEWTDEQKQVLNAVSDGKSVFITGCAGTGKTFLLEEVIKKLKKIHGRSSVYVTASTGVASCALNGLTLHSFAGIGLGELGHDDLLKRVQNNSKACKRWIKAKALVIDEISMVDADLFDHLEYIARTLRENGNDNVWGELQLIASGDFCQLPPINKKNGYAFEAKCWSASFDLQILLTQVYRQSDPLLVKILKGIRIGENNPDDLKLLEGCLSGYEPDPSAVKLYPRLEDVNRVNKDKLERLQREIYVYSAEDTGDENWKRQLDSGIAPSELELCIGARVMLVKNINPFRKLVNGSTGTVIDFCHTFEGKFLPMVKFDCGIELAVKRETWAVMDGDKVVAKRIQIPLILSYALSIHKCQGMTLQMLHTDLSRVFDFGMVYVALSRVQSLNGLSLSGLDPSKIKAHPKVLKFYQDFNKG